MRLLGGTELLAVLAALALHTSEEAEGNNSDDEDNKDDEDHNQSDDASAKGIGSVADVAIHRGTGDLSQVGISAALEGSEETSGVSSLDVGAEGVDDSLLLSLGSEDSDVDIGSNSVEGSSSGGVVDISDLDGGRGDAVLGAQLVGNGLSEDLVGGRSLEGRGRDTLDLKRKVDEELAVTRVLTRSVDEAAGGISQLPDTRGGTSADSLTQSGLHTSLAIGAGDVGSETSLSLRPSTIGGTGDGEDADGDGGGTGTTSIGGLDGVGLTTDGDGGSTVDLTVRGAEGETAGELRIDGVAGYLILSDRNETSDSVTLVEGVGSVVVTDGGESEDTVINSRTPGSGTTVVGAGTSLLTLVIGGETVLSGLLVDLSHWPAGVSRAGKSINSDLKNEGESTRSVAASDVVGSKVGIGSRSTADDTIASAELKVDRKTRSNSEGKLSTRADRGSISRNTLVEGVDGLRIREAGRRIDNTKVLLSTKDTISTRSSLKALVANTAVLEGITTLRSRTPSTISSTSSRSVSGIEAKLRKLHVTSTTNGSSVPVNSFIVTFSNNHSVGVVRNSRIEIIRESLTIASEVLVTSTMKNSPSSTVIVRTLNDPTRRMSCVAIVTIGDLVLVGKLSSAIVVGPLINGTNTTRTS